LFLLKAGMLVLLNRGRLKPEAFRCSSLTVVLVSLVSPLYVLQGAVRARVVSQVIANRLVLSLAVVKRTTCCAPLMRRPFLGRVPHR
jgi:hypothetical protein